jgi:hypothetical protein
MGSRGRQHAQPFENGHPRFDEVFLAAEQVGSSVDRNFPQEMQPCPRVPPGQSPLLHKGVSVSPVYTLDTKIESHQQALDPEKDTAPGDRTARSITLSRKSGKTGVEEEDQANDTQAAEGCVARRERLEIATPDPPDTDKGCGEESEEKHARPWEPAIEKESSSARGHDSDNCQKEDDCAANLAEDKIARNGEPSRDGISKHRQDEESHAVNRRAGIFLKLVKRADCGRDTVVIICVCGRRACRRHTVSIPMKTYHP